MGVLERPRMRRCEVQTVVYCKIILIEVNCLEVCRAVKLSLPAGRHPLGSSVRCERLHWTVEVRLH
jgi:hypothetical protein